jgi:hypothetical protein
MNIKEKLYYLIIHYMLGEYDAQTYSDEFSNIFCHCDLAEIEKYLTKNEQELFGEIERIASRVSCIEDDIIKNPGVYFTEKDIKEKTMEVCEKLNIKY